MLEVQHITKIYNPGTVHETCLFRDFTLQIAQGSFVSVVGSNGSGKTSLLNILCGSIPVESGSILMELTAKIVQEKHLTTLMVTHNLRHALTYGDRLLMLHEGQVVLDRQGEEKRATQLDDILGLFNAISIECGN